ncbi:MAG: polysaccharide biosynthesis/export family protein [Phycisphaerales bacterium JB043]
MMTRGTSLNRRPLLNRAIGCLLCLGVLSGLGCEVDSFIDPSVVGRWEYTPTIVPILDRIDVIERDAGEFVETSPVMPEDLLPHIEDYRIGSGDGLFIEIFDFLQPGVATPFERRVDQRGGFDLPQIGRVDVMNMTPDQAREQIRTLLREAGIIEDALVSVQVLDRRDSTYAIFGSIAGTGRYVLAEPDYRLLEAITEAGGMAPGTQRIFIIRQTALADAVRGTPGISPPVLEQPSDPSQNGIDINELIDELTNDGGSPAQLAPNQISPTNAQNIQSAPPIDLPESEDDRDGENRWIFVDGQWVRSSETDASVEEDQLLQASGEMVTQRVIEVPVDPLLAGDARYNIVIRPGDIIRVPGPDQGFFYLAGPGINRPGVYQLPSVGKMTLSKAIMSSGGLSAVAIPSRVDLTRMIGEDRQATIRLNLRAIAEGTHPDVFIKPDDMINVGTNFWAQPLAIIRNGFRFTYGFGFLIDRNFANDIFGPPPTDRGF